MASEERLLRELRTRAEQDAEQRRALEARNAEAAEQERIVLVERLFEGLCEAKSQASAHLRAIFSLSDETEASLVWFARPPWLTSQNLRRGVRGDFTIYLAVELLAVELNVAVHFSASGQPLHRIAGSGVYVEIDHEGRPIHTAQGLLDAVEYCR